MSYLLWLSVLKSKLVTLTTPTLNVHALSDVMHPFRAQTAFLARYQPSTRWKWCFVSLSMHSGREVVHPVPTMTLSILEVHNITDTPTCHTISVLLTHYTGSAHKTEHNCYAQQQFSCNSPCTSACQCSTTHHTAFQNPSMHANNTNTTRHSWQNGTWCRNGVKV